MWNEVLSRIWTCVAMSISYNGNHSTMNAWKVFKEVLKEHNFDRLELCYLRKLLGSFFCFLKFGGDFQDSRYFSNDDLFPCCFQHNLSGEISFDHLQVWWEPGLQKTRVLFSFLSSFSSRKTIQSKSGQTRDLRLCWLVLLSFLMAYQASWAIQCQNYPYRRTEGVLFNLQIKDISPRVNIIARLELEVAYYDVTVQVISHYTSGSLSNCVGLGFSRWDEIK